MTIALRRVTAETFAEFRDGFVEDWAADLAAVNAVSIEKARVEAVARTASDLGSGEAPPNHHLFWITLLSETGETGETGERVGRLWFVVSDARAFLEDITVEPTFRGRGFGREAMELMERELRELGVGRVELSVDAINPRAKALYERCGYAVTGFRMAKPLAR